MSTVRTGIVVPTLGTRSKFLEQSLQSIRKAGNVQICIVCPAQVDLSDQLERGLFDYRVEDPKTGLPGAINAGLSSFPPEIEFLSWLGDDDLLEPDSIQGLERLLDGEQFDFVWGQCRYINEQNQPIWINKSGKWARFVMRLGPNLIPQPGSIFTRRAFEELKGLDMNYSWAFDQDFFTRLLLKYDGVYAPHVLASFRWHAGSLSAGAREGSVRESSQIRIKYMPQGARTVARLWEPVVRRAIMMAGTRINRRAKPK